MKDCKQSPNCAMYSADTTTLTAFEYLCLVYDTCRLCRFKTFLGMGKFLALLIAKLAF